MACQERARAVTSGAVNEGNRHLFDYGIPVADKPDF
ncbi:MAG: hypothetical protein QOK44_1973 [Betaproteobacteria bacterium]|nr:hypothetical protein [Betaproteobacteria bacterium]